MINPTPKSKEISTFVRYMPDGSGRDSYINFKSGGFLREMHKTELRPHYLQLVKNHTNKLSQTRDLRKTSWSFKYKSDGTGRDSYILQGSGGLQAEYREQKPYNLTLRPEYVENFNPNVFKFFNMKNNNKSQETKYEKFGNNSIDKTYMFTDNNEGFDKINNKIYNLKKNNMNNLTSIPQKEKRTNSQDVNDSNVFYCKFVSRDEYLMGAKLKKIQNGVTKRLYNDCVNKQESLIKNADNMKLTKGIKSASPCQKNKIFNPSLNIGISSSKKRCNLDQHNIEKLNVDTVTSNNHLYYPNNMSFNDIKVQRIKPNNKFEDFKINDKMTVKNFNSITNFNNFIRMSNKDQKRLNDKCFPEKAETFVEYNIPHPTESQIRKLQKRKKEHLEINNINLNTTRNNTNAIINFTKENNSNLFPEVLDQKSLKVNENLTRNTKPSIKFDKNSIGNLKTCPNESLNPNKNLMSKDLKIQLFIEDLKKFNNSKYEKSGKKPINYVFPSHKKLIEELGNNK